VTPIRLERNISKTTWARYFKFGVELCVGNAERAHKYFPRKWTWPRSRDTYIFWHTIEHICKTSWARDFKFGTRLWLIIIALWLSGSACPLWSSTVGYPSDSLASCYSCLLLCQMFQHGQFSRKKFGPESSLLSPPPNFPPGLRPCNGSLWLISYS